MRSPLFLIKDPELIKQMAVKDFDHFLNHRINLDETHDPLLGRSLLFLKGQRWKDMRSTLGPAFTSSKMRTMFQLISECSSATVDFLEKEVKDGKPLLTDMKDFFTRFTTDVIATCAFGIKIFGISLFEKEFHDFFRNLVWDTIHHRERENIYRPDMINLLIEARKGTLQNEEERQETLNEGFAVVQDTKIGEAIHERNLVEDDLTAQCLNFFLAGSDTTSSSLCFTAHELAVNPEVQKKLLLEVDATRESLGGKPLTYEVLQNMKYLDMVMSAGIITDRKCVKPYTIRTDEISCDVKIGETIFIPIVSIHHDPQYFPNPSRFDPERFSEENKHKINPFTYIPFGVGPRNCIGSRFALMETKAIIYYILTKFTFEVSEKTQIPLKFPTISKALGISLFTKEFSSFFRNLVWDTIHHRERENIYRPDMINLLIQARKGKLHHEEEGQESLSEGFAVVQETKIGEAIHQSKFVDDDLTAQCLIFFLAGFDTSSTCMCFTAHELAVNPEVQKKLLLEVDATRESLGGKPLTYEALQKMTYLDMVISESLRYWPPGVATDRKCVKPYRIKTDEISCDVKVGEAILIPIVSLHHDPKYFPNPSRFDPERFSEENKHKINPFAYLPFGVGPRNCIGSRFALMETKAIIYYILTKFTFEVSEKTQVPLKLAKAGFALKPQKGFWVDLKPRNL
uniref:Uncharacterized protein n=1 Tax=Phlebotomus papatasi TaxID=29031 RepID=A0A1B0DEZ0_PHLPP